MGTASSKPVGLCRDDLPSTNPSHTLKDPNQIKVTTEGTTIHARPSQSFSETYHEARSKFRYVATKLLNKDNNIVQLHTFEVIPGRDYTIDIVVIKGDDDDDDGGLVIHTSGCHGVEGFAGSAVQIAYLQHLLDTNYFDNTTTSIKGTKPTIILVHALNPYGMAHNRRFNENNVDLNRNALTDNEWKEILQERDINIASYEKFDKSMFNPPRAPKWIDAYYIFVKSIVAIVMYGFVNMKRSIVAGQYHNPRGIFYGGNELESSHVILRDFLIENGYTKKKEGLVTWIDVHTGLGPCGVDTLLADLDSTANVKDAFPGAPLQDIEGKEGSDVSSGYDLSRGFIKSFYTRLFPPLAQPLILTQEFGTKPGILVARGMILENMAFNFAPEHQPKWAEFSRDAFYVRTDEWRKNILFRGLTVLCQAIKRSTEDANNKQ